VRRGAKSIQNDWYPGVTGPRVAEATGRLRQRVQKPQCQKTTESGPSGLDPEWDSPCRLFFVRSPRIRTQPGCEVPVYRIPPERVRTEPAFGVVATGSEPRPSRAEPSADHRTWISVCRSTVRRWLLATSHCLARSDSGQMLWTVSQKRCE
jgi:hypothetical protein